ncbi:hypothetical protein BJ138DRAFT_1109364 [Hygrophoropsis aurantiaca]|uniref:Uncharacterized protein n=1 Tax=Hygrophoropsis aurantiaca TaxID=72124 RepID=A0ACB8ARK2_9AGAM|nr:hypothetical protein BJ138DRAFT_1109364 [Hygrophoropsis aurantiaca]
MATPLSTACANARRADWRTTQKSLLLLSTSNFQPKSTHTRFSSSSDMSNQYRYQDINTTIRIIDDEVLELRKLESDLLARLYHLQDRITRKQAHAGRLKNSLIPVYRLPNEILLACFHLAVQSWLTESTDTDERITEVYVEDDYRPEKPVDFPCTHTTAIALSHVSHHWRQVAINMPSLWTNLAVAPRLERQLNIPRLRDNIGRAKGMPVTLTFRNIKWSGMLSSTQLLAIESLVQQEQITGLAFLDSATILWRILDGGGERRSASPGVLSHLTALTIFEISGTFPPSELKPLLSATPQLKSLRLGVSCWARTYDDDDWMGTDEIHLPMLDTMTIIDWSRQMQYFLRSLSAPALRQFKLLCWDPNRGVRPSCLFINNVPRFPNVQHLVFHSSYPFDREIVRAFTGVTHLTLKCHRTFGNPEVFWPNLQHLNLDFAFAYVDSNRGLRVTGLQASEDRVHPLQISVFDSSKVINAHALFQCYKELQRYGNLEGPRMDEFRQWHADGEPELTRNNLAAVLHTQHYY